MNDDEDQIIQIIPGGGWWIGHEEWAEPIVAWGLTKAGSVVPLETDGDGMVDVARYEGATIYHPDSRGSSAYEAERSEVLNAFEAAENEGRLERTAPPESGS